MHICMYKIDTNYGYLLNYENESENNQINTI